ncbi:MAG TPA: AMIN domain-containing protein [Oscillatoriaceae cyanobacterium]
MMLHRGFLRLAGVSLILALVLGPTPARADGPVTITNIAYQRDRHSLVLDISGPVTISTLSLKSPPRLVVDVPTATLMTKNRELTVFDTMVKRVRVSQFQVFPPMVRIVMETATEKEPLIAVQQTGAHLYITLAPARAMHDATPTPADTPSEAPTEAPSPLPTPTPLPPPTPPVVATPAPVFSHAPTPVPLPSIRRHAGVVHTQWLATPTHKLVQSPQPVSSPQDESELETLPGQN